ncbi:substrate-binding domain-containing protein [Coraliomargarita akajimensis]|uniref:ABC-type sugar transport system periplasmic component-like protein n=1 Tax=Coraliomargarita akajimensis (strain DSM 45221 / IAM 15411 / JCM 23193 / KCTC 12865 / 04OKA010-24) TaxID=583355 RepID=D5EJN7_CORAD|nr:substrate-binding domain-containing protein [Coraliomargarita akajimensis]ADE54636.1 ABC-type sugar transport system periplasmic component-like protein [Coraliomargarita akajimensis DSM 45221]
MSFVSRFSSTLALAIFVSLGVSSVQAQNREVLAEFKIGIVGRDMASPSYQAAHTGALDAARKLSEEYSIDLELVVKTPKLAEGESQSTALAELLVEDADGLVISPEANAEVEASIQFAVETGQSVVIVDSPMMPEGALANVRADEAEVGRQAAKAIIPKLPTGGRVALLVEEPMSDAQRERLQGAREVLGFRRIETVVRTGADYTSSIAAIQSAVAEDRNHLIKGWVFLTDAPLRGVPAFPWKPGKTPCVAVQTSPSAFMFMDQGYLTALISHPYYDWGYRSVEILLADLYREQGPEQAEILMPTEVVDWRNLEDYRKRWLQWLQ